MLYNITRGWVTHNEVFLSNLIRRLDCNDIFSFLDERASNHYKMLMFWDNRDISRFLDIRE